MIVGHHAGEHLLVLLVGGGTAAVPALLLVTRVRVSHLLGVLRRWGTWRTPS